MSVLLNTIVKRIVRHMVHDYRLNWVLASTGSQAVLPLPANLDFARLDEAGLLHIAATPDPQFRKALGYDRLGATGYMLAQDGAPTSVAHFVDLSRYEDASSWPLRANEVALLHIATHEDAQGRGYAPILISHATQAMLSPQRTCAIAFVWWNHRASLRAFDRAGWHRVGFSVELIGRHGKTRHLHIPLPALFRRAPAEPATSARNHMPHPARHP